MHDVAATAHGRAKALMRPENSTADERARVDRFLARALRNLDRYAEALDLYRGAREVFEPDFPGEVAQCDQGIAVCLRNLGQWQQAIDIQTNLLAEDAMSDERRGSCEQGLGATLWAVGRHAEAADHFRLAAGCFRACGLDLDEAHCLLNEAAALIELDDAEEALTLLRRARAVYETEEAEVRIAQCDENRASALRRLRRPDEALALYDQSRQRLADIGRTLMAARCEYGKGLALLDLERPVDAAAAFRSCLSVFETEGDDIGVADSLAGLASALHRQGAGEEALRQALRAVEVVDRRRYDFRDPLTRMSWRDRFSDAYAHALDIAVELGRAETVAELVEQARLQGLPRAATGSLEEAQPGVPAIAASLGEFPLNSPPPVRFRRPPPGTEDEATHTPAVYLAELLEVAGGPGSWWWGTWIFGDILYWVLIDSAGAADAGSEPVRRESRTGTLLNEIAASFPQAFDSLDQAWHRIERNPLLGDRPDEESMARELGECLIPSRLRAALLAHSHEDPLSLMVAPAPALGRVPLPVIAVSDGDTGASVRLIERATIRLAPPATLLHQIARRRRQKAPGRTLPVMLAVVNPQGNLLFPGRPPSDTQVVLSEDSSPGVSAATRRNLARSLQNLEGGEAGLFLYAGHVHTQIPGKAATASLALLDGPVSAHDLLAQDGDRSLRFPSIAVLAGCDSSGVGADPAGEWFGIGSAVLWAGANNVVVTSWAILDHPGTALLQERIVEVLRQGGDPAESLRKVQLDYLAEWRAPPPTTSFDDDLGGSPYLWSSFVAFGAFDAPMEA